MKHHYNPWRARSEGLGGLGQLAVQEGEVHSECTRCKVKVKIGAKGGPKFWVNGRWVTKRPPCEPV